MKKLQFLILILASVLILPSCAGIGDGALVGGGGYSPTKQTESVDTVVEITARIETGNKEALVKPSTVAELGEINSCKISLIVSDTVKTMKIFSDKDAAEIYRLFSESKLEPTGSNSGLILSNCIQVYFTDTNGDYEEYYVGVSNVFDKFDSSTYGITGKIDGLYNSLKGYLQ